MVRIRYIIIALVFCAALLSAYPPSAGASQANSNNYGVSEVQFGSGGELRACSTTYCAKQSAGELTVGNTRSANYQAQAGFNTNREPFLAVTVASGIVNLGTLDTGTTASGSTTFSISSYLASGYDVYIDGTSLKNATNGHVLAPMAAAGPRQAGIEQFGLNLRQNTVPVVGADPVQVPDNTFSFGTPAAGYNTPDSFKYVAGDKIAGSTSSSGFTDFTMSMIANVGTTTAGGTYGGRLMLNVVPTF
ncbi:MAG TPA: hypothetical protein VF572_02940 [Candidatus Saccharimonadales bacterium]|jgi:hypothetical protein